MGRYIVRRLLYMVVVVVVVSFITFGLMHAVPGGPFSREKALPAETIKILNERYHLDDPLWRQYLDYLNNTMIPRITSTPPTTSLTDDFLISVKMGSVWLRWMNFGPSFHSRSRTVNDIFRANLPISAQLGVMALTVGIVLGMPLGIMAALKQNTLYDYAGMATAIFGVSVPVIVLGPHIGMAIRGLPQMAAADGLGRKTALSDGLPALAPGLGLLQVRDHAFGCTGPGLFGHHCPADARQPAANRTRGLYSHGPGKRTA